MGKQHEFKCRGCEKTFVARDETHKRKILKDFSDNCMCGCNRCRLGEWTTRTYKTPKKNKCSLDVPKPGSQGKMLPKEQRRDYSPFLEKEVKKVSDVKEYDRDHPDMEYAAGADVDDFMDEETKQHWEEQKRKRKKRKEAEDE